MMIYVSDIKRESIGDIIEKEKNRNSAILSFFIFGKVFDTKFKKNEDNDYRTYP